MDLPWLEKYRPTHLGDVVGNIEIIGRLRKLAEQGTTANMIFAGPPGTGKTTAALCLAADLVGQSRVAEAVLELNASDERGIDTIRGKIKTFAARKITLPENRQKIVLLDEADSVTPAAQQALRRIIETYADKTRFILACNSSEKIIEPLQSRCIVLRFTRLEDSDVRARVAAVCALENAQYTEDGINALCFCAEGDMRQAINNAQSVCYGVGLITAENVYAVCDVPNPVQTEEIVVLCSRKQYEQAAEQMQRLLQKGYAKIDLITSFFRVVKTLSGTKISEETRLQFMQEIAQTQLCILAGIDGLQLQGMVGRMSI